MNKYALTYWNGSRWVYLTNGKRFWEVRLFATKEEALALAGETAPDWLRIHVLALSDKSITHLNQEVRLLP